MRTLHGESEEMLVSRGDLKLLVWWQLVGLDGLIAFTKPERKKEVKEWLMTLSDSEYSIGLDTDDAVENLRLVTTFSDLAMYTNPDGDKSCKRAWLQGIPSENLARLHACVCKATKVRQQVSKARRRSIAVANLIEKQVRSTTAMNKEESSMELAQMAEHNENLRAEIEKLQSDEGVPQLDDGMWNSNLSTVMKLRQQLSDILHGKFAGLPKFTDSVSVVLETFKWYGATDNKVEDHEVGVMESLHGRRALPAVWSATHGFGKAEFTQLAQSVSNSDVIYGMSADDAEIPAAEVKHGLSVMLREMHEAADQTGTARGIGYGHLIDYMVQSAQIDGAWVDPARVKRKFGDSRNPARTGPGGSAEGFNLGPKCGTGEIGTQAMAVLPQAYDGSGVFKFEFYKKKTSTVPTAILYVLLSPHPQASMSGADTILVPFRIFGHHNLFSEPPNLCPISGTVVNNVVKVDLAYIDSLLKTLKPAIAKAMTKRIEKSNASKGKWIKKTCIRRGVWHEYYWWQPN